MALEFCPAAVPATSWQEPSPENSSKGDPEELHATLQVTQNAQLLLQGYLVRHDSSEGGLHAATLVLAIPLHLRCCQIFASGRTRQTHFQANDQSTEEADFSPCRFDSSSRVDFLERIRSWKSRRDARIREEKERRARRELKECTFQPAITRYESPLRERPVSIAILFVLKLCKSKDSSLSATVKGWAAVSVKPGLREERRGATVGTETCTFSHQSPRKDPPSKRRNGEHKLLRCNVSVLSAGEV